MQVSSSEWTPSLWRYLVPVLSILTISGSLSAQDGGSGFNYLEVKLVDSEGNSPSDAAVEITLDGTTFPMMADDKGIVSLNVSSNNQTSLSIKADCEGYAATVAAWSRGQKIPAEFALTLQPAVEIGGIVHDEQGNPVEGVKVEATNPMDTFAPGAMGGTITGELGTTDAQGRWSYAKAPDSKINVFLKVSHPDYLEDNLRHPVTNEQLRSKDHILVLKKGIELRGTITDPLGMPVKGAKVLLGTNQWNNQIDERTTNDEGTFLFGNRPPETVVMTVYSPDYAPELRVVDAKREMGPVDFKLVEGKPLRMRVTDPDGMPAEGIRVSADEWRGHRTLSRLGLPDRTDANGIYVWEHAPEEVIDFDFWHRDYMSLRNQKLQPGEEHKITLAWPLEITGKVKDSESGAGVKNFNVIKGIKWSENNSQIHWERHNTTSGRQGRLSLTLREPRYRHLVRIEAPGYKPVVSRGIKSDEGEVKLEFELEKGTGPTGIVSLPNGQPASGVKIATAEVGGQLNIHNGTDLFNGESQTTTTDEQGRYQLPFQIGEFAVVFLHDEGWNQLTSNEISNSPNVKLKEWARIEGVTMDGQEPVSGDTLQLNFSNSYNPDRPMVFWNYSGTADFDGKFTIERVRSGSATIGRNVMFGKDGHGNYRMSSYSHTEPVDLQLGATSTVQIGGTGRNVKGKFLIDPKHHSRIEWSMAQLSLYGRPPRIETPGGILYQWGKAIAEGSGFAPSTTIAAQRQSDFHHNYGARVDEQGTFELHDVQPGRYSMSLSVYEKTLGGDFNWNPIGRFNTTVDVPHPVDEADTGIVDLGEHEVKITTSEAASATFWTLQATPAPIAVEVDTADEETGQEPSSEEAPVEIDPQAQ